MSTDQVSNGQIEADWTIWANWHTLRRRQLPLLRFREPGRDGRLREDGQACRLRRLRSAELCRLAYRHRGEARKRITSPIQSSLTCICTFLKTTFSGVLRAPSKATAKDEQGEFAFCFPFEAHTRRCMHGVISDIFRRFSAIFSCGCSSHQLHHYLNWKGSLLGRGRLGR